MAINHYQLLGIPEDADSRQIKAAYRSMAKRFHPDANKGSEAAAELFRKLNEAYRILSDEQLRKVYNQHVTPQRATPVPRPQPRKAAKPDPQQKFNRFLNSLLDAIFEAPETTPTEPLRQAAPAPQKTTHNVRRQPDFNFYYSLAKEQEKEGYRCDADGIYRREPKRAKNRQNNRFGPVPGSSLILLFLAGFLEFFKS